MPFQGGEHLLMPKGGAHGFNYFGGNQDTEVSTSDLEKPKKIIS